MVSYTLKGENGHTFSIISSWHPDFYSITFSRFITYKLWSITTMLNFFEVGFITTTSPIFNSFPISKLFWFICCLVGFYYQLVFLKRDSQFLYYKTSLSTVYYWKDNLSGYKIIKSHILSLRTSETLLPSDTNEEIWCQPNLLSPLSP